jgi:hypothetical protein
VAISGVSQNSAHLASVSNVYAANDSKTKPDPKAQNVLPVVPQKPVKDSVSISGQAQALLASLKAYSPPEKAMENGSKK